MAKQSLDSVQVVRALAALSVLLFHSGEVTQQILGMALAGRVFAAGFSGVDMFFVLSGFIILHTARPQHTTAGRFLALRAVRIYPVYWVITGLLVAAHLIHPSPGQAHRGDPALVAGSLLLLPQPKHVVVVAWTLVYEMLFYAVVAATYFRRRVWLDRVFIAWALLIGLAHTLGWQPASFALQTLLNPIVLEFYLGCWVARLYQRHPRLVWQPVLALGVLLMAGSWVLYLQAGPALAQQMSGVLRCVFFGVPAALLLAGLLYYRGPVPRPLVAIGDATYSVYLLHGVLIAALMKLAVAAGLPAWLGKPATAVLALAATLLVAMLFYRVVERPLVGRLKAALAGPVHGPVHGPKHGTGPASPA